MRCGLAVELRCPKGSVGFHAEVDVQEESIRSARKELGPAETWEWRLNIPRSQIAMLAVQSLLDTQLQVNDSLIRLQGQATTDFGLLYAVRTDEKTGAAEAFGNLPFDGDLTTIRVTNLTAKRSRVDIIVAEHSVQPQVSS